MRRRATSELSARRSPSTQSEVVDLEGGAVGRRGGGHRFLETELWVWEVKEEAPSEYHLFSLVLPEVC